MLRRLPSILVAASFALTHVVAVTGIASAQPTTSGDRADDLYRQGIAAFEAGNLDEAHRLLAEAWSLKKGVDIAANLGIVALKQGKMIEAAEVLSYAVDHFPLAGSPEARNALSEKLAEAKKSVVGVKVTSNVAGATVTLDDGSFGEAPIANEKFVEPGRRRFKATHAGYAPYEVTVDLVAGQPITVDLRLEPEKGTDPKPPQGEPLPAWPMFVLGGVTAAGLGVGIGFLVMNQSAKSELEDSGCTNASCGAALQGSVDDYNMGGSGAIGGFVAAGVGAIGLVTYGILYGMSEGAAEPDKPDEQAVRFVPWVGPGIAGGAISHSF
jgi:hypothetical protein